MSAEKRAQKAKRRARRKVWRNGHWTLRAKFVTLNEQHDLNLMAEQRRIRELNPHLAGSGYIYHYEID